MSSVLPFAHDRRRRRRRVEANDMYGSAIVPFPLSRQRHIVERHARAMRALMPDEAKAYLTKVLERVCADLDALGVDCEDCQGDVINDLASAIGRELHGPDFRLEVGGQK